MSSIENQSTRTSARSKPRACLSVERLAAANEVEWISLRGGPLPPGFNAISQMITGPGDTVGRGQRAVGLRHKEKGRQHQSPPNLLHHIPTIFYSMKNGTQQILY